MSRAAVLIAALALPAAAQAQAIPGVSRVGQCAITRIVAVGQRLVDGEGRPIAGSGSAVELANGVVGVSYDQVAGVNRSRRGDRVRTCLVSIPRDCPPGDARGRFYRTTNLRTKARWMLPDSQHMCGGA